MPQALRQRPRSPSGQLPIPYTVPVIDGVPDFRVSDGEKWLECVTRGLCPLCGEEIKGNFWFVGGPLCHENRLFLDPGMHRDCAEYALQVCPFLASPKGHYANLGQRPPPEGFTVFPIVGPTRPDVFMLGRARSYRVSGALILADRWLEVVWWRDGVELLPNGQPKPASWGVWCEVWGGVTGRREAWLKQNGKVALFATRGAAAGEAARHMSRQMGAPHRTANYRYSAKEYRP